MWCRAQMGASPQLWLSLWEISFFLLVSRGYHHFFGLGKGNTVFFRMVSRGVPPFEDEAIWHRQTIFTQELLVLAGFGQCSRSGCLRFGVFNKMVIRQNHGGPHHDRFMVRDLSLAVPPCLQSAAVVTLRSGLFHSFDCAVRDLVHCYQRG